jgi:hypothetical protein
MNELKIPVPFLFNPLKHHLVALISILNNTDFPAIFTVLKPLGASQMDMYTGTLTLPQIFTEIGSFLDETGIWEQDNYHNYLTRHDDYLTLKLSDRSEWILRAAKGARYVHIHPGRHVPHTLRIKATALKTALAYHAAKVHGKLTGELPRYLKPRCSDSWRSMPGKCR